MPFKTITIPLKLLGALETTFGALKTTFGVLDKH